MTAKASTAMQEEHSQQDKVAELQAEVAALHEELRRAQRLAAVGTIAAFAVHEFNNILTPIINYARLAKSNPKMIPKAIASASEDGLRATEICEALLGIADENRTREAAEHGLDDMTREILLAMARAPHKDGIDLSVDIPPDLTVMTRRCEFQHVLLNLLINAREAVMAKPPPRSIRVAAVRDNGWAVVRIEDNGVGIQPAIIEKIFQPFFTTRSDNGDGRSRGHGLGLAMCREIMDMLDGEISVESTVDVGTTFTLRLPA